MSKSILVIDTPENCVKCILYHYTSCRCYIIGKFQNNISEDYKPDWCPLRDFPEKRKVSLQYPYLHQIIADGWNACIDEILKGANKNE